jgi:hypothetical protein
VELVAHLALLVRPLLTQAAVADRAVQQVAVVPAVAVQEIIQQEPQTLAAVEVDMRLVVLESLFFQCLQQTTLAHTQVHR